MNTLTPEQEAADLAIGGKLLVKVRLEFLWAIKERMQQMRIHMILGRGDLARAESYKVEKDINALVAEAGK